MTKFSSFFHHVLLEFGLFSLFLGYTVLSRLLCSILRVLCITFHFNLFGGGILEEFQAVTRLPMDSPKSLTQPWLWSLLTCSLSSCLRSTRKEPWELDFQPKYQIPLPSPRMFTTNSRAEERTFRNLDWGWVKAHSAGDREYGHWQLLGKKECYRLLDTAVPHLYFEKTHRKLEIKSRVRKFRCS